MKKKRKSLGKGLEEIFGSGVHDLIENIENKEIERRQGDVKEIEIANIIVNPYQPRNHFEDTKLQELATSIQTHGVFTPILVRKVRDQYQLIAGERRVRACKLVGIEQIPAIVVEYDELQAMEVAILENIQREDLNIIEEAQAYQKLINKYDYAHEELGNRLGKSRSHITNTLRLLKLPEEVQKMVISQELTMGHIRALVTLEPEEALLQAQKAAKQRLSVRELEDNIKALKKEKLPVKKATPEESARDNRAYLEEMLADTLQTKVRIKRQTLEIYFDNDEDLNRLLGIMKLLEEHE